MSAADEKLVQQDAWSQLRRHTRARIALGRCGNAVPTEALLDFRMGHAAARDAVHVPLDFHELHSAVQQLTALPVVQLHSAARDRAEYLRRPDLGAKPDQTSAAALSGMATAKACDLALVAADGLSAAALAENLIPLLQILLPKIRQAGLRLAPFCLVAQGRVAVGDHVGAALNARLTVMMIGERPGLSSHNSLGVYLTHNARPGVGNDKRNCISNIRPEGLPHEAAVEKLIFLIGESLRRGISGVALKDTQTADEGRRLKD